VNRGDVGVTERGEQTGFALEAGESIRIADVQGLKQFDRHLTVQVLIARAIHLPHAACSDDAERHCTLKPAGDCLRRFTPQES
jgi:hypothetical protein